MLSRYLWSLKSGKQVTFNNFIKKIITLLIPFLEFRILLICYWFVIESKFRELDLGSIWFLIFLFFVEILIQCIILKPKNIFYNLILILGLIILLYKMNAVQLQQVNIFAWIMRLLNGALWYTFGNLIGIIKKNINFNRELVKNIFMLIFGLLSVYMSQVNTLISIWSNQFGIYFIFLLNAFIGTLFFYLLCEKIGTNIFFEWLGRNTIVILATHEPIKRILLKIIERITIKLQHPIYIKDIQNNVLYSMGILFLIIFVEIWVINLFKFLKRTVGKKIKYLLDFIN